MTTLVNILAINRYPDSMARRSTWIAVALAVAVLAIVIAVIASAWSGLGDTGMSAGGWEALVFGVVVTLALGIGLMALVFIYNRLVVCATGGNVMWMAGC